MQLSHMHSCPVLCTLQPAPANSTVKFWHTWLQDGREVRYLQRSPLLDPAESPGFADEVVATAAALLSAARQGAHSARSAPADAAGAPRHQSIIRACAAAEVGPWTAQLGSEGC